MKPLLVMALCAAIAGFVAISGTAQVSAPRRIINCPVGSPAGVTAAAFSPSGTRLAYARQARAGDVSIVVSTLRGRVVTRRANDLPGAPTALTWAPIGSRLAYVSGDELHVLDASDRIMLRGNGRIAIGGWLPDASTLVISTGLLPSAESYLVDTITGAVRDLGPGARAVPSPDGTRIALSVSMPSPSDVFPGQSQHLQVLNLASGERRTIFRSRAPLTALAWSPDSRQIAFLWYIDEEPDLMAQNADGTSTGLFGREHGALPTQIGMIAPIRWTRRGIVGNALFEDRGSAVAFYDVVTGRPRYRGVSGYVASIADVSGSGHVAYIAGPADVLPGAAGSGLRVAVWPGTDDRSLFPCRGTSGSDQLKASVDPTTILAGAGNDVVDARNHQRDVVDCGSGADTVKLDHADVARACERVQRSRQ